MSSKVLRIVRVVTVVAWLLMVVDVLPFGPHLPADVSLFTVAVGCLGGYAWIAAANARPVDEVYRAGVHVGYRRCQLEQESGNVAKLEERPSRLRLVSERAEGH